MQAAPKLRRELSSSVTAQSLFLPFRNTEKFEPMTTVSGLRLSRKAFCEGLVKIGEIGDVPVHLSEGDCDGGAAGGLDEELGSSLLETLEERYGFLEIYDRGTDARRTESAGKTFPGRYFRTDEKILVIDRLGDSLIELKRKTTAILPRAAVLPFPVVVWTQYL